MFEVALFLQNRISLGTPLKRKTAPRRMPPGHYSTTSISMQRQLPEASKVPSAFILPTTVTWRPSIFHSPFSRFQQFM